MSDVDVHDIARKVDQLARDNAFDTAGSRDTTEYEEVYRDTVADLLSGLQGDDWADLAPRRLSPSEAAAVRAEIRQNRQRVASGAEERRTVADLRDVTLYFRPNPMPRWPGSDYQMVIMRGEDVIADFWVVRRDDGTHEMDIVTARQGWGPLVYEIAMTYAQSRGTWFAPSMETSEFSGRIWEKFYERSGPGGDVDREPLFEPTRQRQAELEGKPWLPFRYRLNTPLALPPFVVVDDATRPRYRKMDGVRRSPPVLDEPRGGSLGAMDQSHADDYVPVDATGKPLAPPSKDYVEAKAIASRANGYVKFVSEVTEEGHRASDYPSRQEALQVAYTQGARFTDVAHVYVPFGGGKLLKRELYDVGSAYHLALKGKLVEKPSHPVQRINQDGTTSALHPDYCGFGCGRMANECGCAGQPRAAAEAPAAACCGACGASEGCGCAGRENAYVPGGKNEPHVAEAYPFSPRPGDPFAPAPGGNPFEILAVVQRETVETAVVVAGAEETARVIYEERAKRGKDAAELRWKRTGDGGYTAPGTLGTYAIGKRKSDRRKGVLPVVLTLKRDEKGLAQVINQFDDVGTAKTFASNYDVIAPQFMGITPKPGGPAALVSPGAPPAQPFKWLGPQPPPPPAGTPEGTVCGPFAFIQRSPEAFSACRKIATSIGAIDSIEDVWRLVSPELVKFDQEVFLVVALGHHGEIREVPVVVGLGQRARVAVDPIDVLRAVILSGASAFYIVHGHPSGHSAKPSPADLDLTKTIQKSSDAAFGKKGREIPATVEFLGHAVVTQKEVGDGRTGQVIRMA